MPEGGVPCPTKAPFHGSLYHFGKGTGFHKKHFSHFDFAAMHCSLFTAQSTATEAGPFRPQPNGVCTLHTTVGAWGLLSREL